MLSKLVMTSVRFGTVCGAAYVTFNQGIWQEPDQSIAAFERVARRLPNIKNYTDKITMNLPIEDFPYLKKPNAIGSFSEYWNRGVVFTFASFAAAPAFISKYSVVALKKTEKVINDSLQSR